MHDTNIDHTAIDRIEIGDTVTTDRTDGHHYARVYHTDQALRNEPFAAAAVDEFAVLRDISRGDTITAAAHDTGTLREAVKPFDAARTAENLAEQDGLPVSDVHATILRAALGAEPAEVAAMTAIDEAWVNLTSETVNNAIEDIMRIERETEQDNDDGDDGEDVTPQPGWQATLGFVSGSNIQ